MYMYTCTSTFGLSFVEKFALFWSVLYYQKFMMWYHFVVWIVDIVTVGIKASWKKRRLS